MADGKKQGRSRVRARVICVVVGLLAGLALAELTVRVLGIGPEMYVIHADRVRISDDPVLQYDLLPGARDGPDHFSSAGLRDREFPEQKPAGVYRIAVIGDSVTFGIGVRGVQTYPRELERLLNRYREPGAPTFQVMNFGVVGYNAAQIAEMPRARVARFHPDCIIYGYVLNDPQAESVEAEALEFLAERWQGGHLAGIGHLLRHSRLYLLLRANLAAAPEEPDLDDREPGFAAFKEQRHVAYLRSLHERAQTWQNVTACLERISPPGGETAAPRVIVTTFPIWWDFGTGAYPLTDVHEQVIAEARGNGLPATDLGPAFERVAGATGERLFFDFLHPTLLGHKVAAMMLLEALCESEVLPEEWLRMERVQAATGSDLHLARILFPPR